MKELIEDSRHDHYWIEDGVLYESYHTIRGLRFRTIAYFDDLDDNERLTEEEVQDLKNRMKTK